MYMGARIDPPYHIQFFGALENIYNIYNKISIYTKIDYCIGVVYLGYSLRILVRKLHFRAPSACLNGMRFTFWKSRASGELFV